MQSQECEECDPYNPTLNTHGMVVELNGADFRGSIFDFGTGRTRTEPDYENSTGQSFNLSDFQLSIEKGSS